MQQAPSSLETFFTVSHLHKIASESWKSSFNSQQSSVTANKVQLEYHVYDQKYDLVEGMKTKNEMVYAFARCKHGKTTISLYSFSIKDGEENKCKFSGIEGEANCMLFMLDHGLSQFKLAIGTKDGMIKFLSLSSEGRISAMQIDVKPIEKILQMDRDLCGQRDLCVALSTDSTVHAIDVDLKEVVYVMRPQLVSCDGARSMCFNFSKTHLMTCTQGGYVVIWRMGSVYKYLTSEMEEGQARPSRIFNLFPAKITHSLCIQGLISCLFYGHIVVLVTPSGLLKFIAISFDSEDEFAVLLSYPLSHPDEIADVKIFESPGAIFIARNRESSWRLQKIKIGQGFNISMVTNYNIDQQMKSSVSQLVLFEDCPIFLLKGRKNFAIGQEPSLFLFTQGSTDRVKDNESSFK